MTYEQEIEVFKSILKQMGDVFEKKRHDYGNSTEDTIRRYGMVSMLVRMRDKLNRLDNLLVEKLRPSVQDESVDDTLLDLANYAVITLLELMKQRAEMLGECTKDSDEINSEGCRTD